MRTLEYEMRFTTPAFLGNAEQAGQWRTPPIKALLRQFWRMVYAADQAFDVDTATMRKAEGELFGVAADAEGASKKSQVRIRLSHWHVGSLKTWLPLATVPHREVPVAVGSDLYLGYGPITLARGAKAPSLKANAAIQADETASVRIAIPEGTEADRCGRALALMHLYGTLGGRSRNGWGSLALTPRDEVSRLDFSSVPSRPWRDALTFDWAHSVGHDQHGPLVWQTDVFDEWKQAVRCLATIKIELRTQFKFPNTAPPHAEPLARHWLSYPITKHWVSKNGWGRDARLPNSLRFKLRPDEQDPKKLRGVVFHVPCLPPAQFRPDRKAIEEVWSRVHGYLDEQSTPKLSRIPY